jgi:hypothetical protein
MDSNKILTPFVAMLFCLFYRRGRNVFTLLNSIIEDVHYHCVWRWPAVFEGHWPETFYNMYFDEWLTVSQTTGMRLIQTRFNTLSFNVLTRYLFRIMPCLNPDILWYTFACVYRIVCVQYHKHASIERPSTFPVKACISECASRLPQVVKKRRCSLGKMHKMPGCAMYLEEQHF